MTLNREKIGINLFLLAVFLLPLQTRWIYSELVLGGEVWEYGKLSLYAVEVLIILSAAFLGKSKLIQSTYPVVRRIVILLGALFIVIGFSKALPLSFNYILHAVVAVFFLFLLFDQRIKIFNVALAFVTGLILPAIFAWIQVATGSSGASTILGMSAQEAKTLGTSVVELESGTRILRGYGTFPHPNIFGGFLATATILMVWLITQIKTKYQTWLLIPIFAISSSLILTFSRNAWLAVAVSTIVFLILRLRANLPLARKTLPLIGFIFFVLITTLTLHLSPATNRFDPTQRLEAKSIEERTSQYKTFEQVIQKNLFTGVGPGGYTVALFEQKPDQPAWSYQPIHNSILLAFAETGLIGIIAIFILLDTLAKQFYKHSKSLNGIFAITLCTALLTLSLFDHYLWSNWSGIILSVLVLGISVRLAGKSV